MVKPIYILSKSKIKGKRFRITMEDHHHDFGSFPFKSGTFIDHQDEKKKAAWTARHKNDKNYNSKHSAIYHSRKLLWTEPTLNKSVKKYEKDHNVKLILEID